MKKSCSIIFLFIVMFFIQNSVVNADDYTCSYYSKNGLWEGRVYYDVKGDELSFRTNASGSISWVMDFTFSKRYDNALTEDDAKKELVKFMDGRCPSQLYVCEGGWEGPFAKEYAILFDMQYQTEAKNYKGKLDFYGTTDFVGNNNCFLLDIYKSESTGDVVDSLGDECDKYEEYLGDWEHQESYYKNLKYNYEQCNTYGKKENCEKYNTYKSEIRSYCSLTIQYGDYQNACLHRCIDELNADINAIEQITSSGDCNVSNRIINWIANIMKWMKYIAPVLVIILSMVDFIKAIASNSDEEVKKTQGKFVKRLIAAALLFIIPFIIQFALETFKLTTDYCGLI